jgi:hypothetical protein
MSNNALILSGLILLASACGGSGTASAPSAPTTSSEQLFDLQTLLTRAEAEAALGEPVGEPELTEASGPLGQARVYYPALDARSARFVQLAVVRDGWVSEPLRARGYGAARLFAETRTGLADGLPVAGVGDEAFWGTNGLHVLDDDVYLTISVGNTNRPENLDLAKGIAVTVVSRLRSAATDG